MSDHEEKKDYPDIPGFYFDKEKRKYYRVTSSGVSNPLHPEKIRRIEGHRESQQKNNQLRKENTVSIPKVIGLFQGAGPSRQNIRSIQTSLIGSTMSQLSKRFSSVVNEQFDDYEIRDALSTIHAENKICTAYSLECGGSIVVTSTLDIGSKTMQHGISNLFPAHKIVDLKPINMHGGSFAGAACQSLRLGDQFISLRPMLQDPALDDKSKTFNFAPTDTIWSVALNSDYVAVGLERKVSLFSMQDSKETTVKVPNENIFVLENGSNNTFAAGTNKGNIHLIDTRSASIESRIEFGAPLSNLKVTDVNLVASGYDHSLSLFDMRNFDKPLASFAEHKNDCRPHLSLALHERLGMISSTGSDHVIRSWSLSDFKLKSTISESDFISCDNPPCFILSDSWGPSCSVAIASANALHYYA